MLSSHRIFTSLPSKPKLLPLSNHITTPGFRADSQLQDQRKDWPIRSHLIHARKEAGPPRKTIVRTVLQVTYNASNKRLFGLGMVGSIQSQVKGTFWRLKDANEVTGRDVGELERVLRV
jgi:hypothetical protein